MRLIAGIILGILLTLGVFYIHDVNVGADAATLAPPAGTEMPAPGTATPPDLTGHRIVNWDVLGAVTRAQIDFAKAQWNRIFSSSTQR